MPALWLALAALATVAIIAAAACGGEEEEAPSPQPTTAVQPTAAAEPTEAEEHEAPTGAISLEAASATITVDGDTSDWSDIPAVTVPMEGIRLDELDPRERAEVKFGEVPPFDAKLRVATDADNIYLLMEVPDDYDFNPDDHHLSPAVAVQFRIEEPAATHMGAEDEDLEEGLGLVDMWHWELDCGPGELSGGVTGIAGGDDPNCNLDDEYATSPEDREDDDSAQAENSLSGVWEHTARAEGAGASGTWVFEMSRPLQTGDPQDAQFESGGTAYLVLAYWDADETPEGWTDAGHLTNSYSGWIEVTLP